MSLSKEWFEHHLTPSGWIDGSCKKDIEGVTNTAIPNDRVLTLRFYEEQSSSFSKVDLFYTKEWKHQDGILINKLSKRFGNKPADYGPEYVLFDK